MPPQDEGLVMHSYSSGTSSPNDDGGGEENTPIIPKKHVHVDQIVEIDPIRRTSVLRRESFVEAFVSSNGPPQIMILMLLLALGLGSTIGVVPAVMSDRYARLNHGLTGDKECNEYGRDEKPEACMLGSADAQNAVAIEQLIANSFTFFTSSLMGALSDEYGRRGILIFGIFLSLLSPLLLVLIQLNSSVSPIWYYCVGAASGLVNWIAVALSSLSDVMPPKWRAPSFGLLLAGFSLGFAMAPQLALLLGHLRVSILSFFAVLMGLIVIIVHFPETLSPESSAQAQLLREEQTDGMSRSEKIVWMMLRPMWELSILNRNSLFRLLSALAFFSGIVSAGDRTLIIYYIEERLGFNDKDVALMFFIMGVLGVFVQGVLLKILNDAIGERLLVTLCFSMGAIHNLLYGLATNKSTIFVAVALSSFVAMSFPTISAIKSNNVEGSEQGRIQGALYSLSALASALGPMTLRFVYHYTKDGALFGPGTMFIFASSLYVIAAFCGFSLPPEANSKKGSDVVADVLAHDTQHDSTNTPLI